MAKITKKYLVMSDKGFLNVGEEFKVFKNFTVDNYCHGRCHLLALVMSEITSLPVGVYIDEYGSEDVDENPSWTLEHAFCYSSFSVEYLFDAKGMSKSEDVKEAYLSDAYEPSEIYGDEAKDMILAWIVNGKLDDFENGEKTALVEYVTSMKLIGLLDHNSAIVNRTAVMDASTTYEI